MTRARFDPSSADLFASHHTRIRRYVLSMVRDPVEADDLTQDVFLQAHRRLDSLRDPNALTSWLYQIATHVCYDRFRKWSRQPEMGPLDFTGSGGEDPAIGGEDEPSLDRVLTQQETIACVRRFVEGLPDRYRNAILLHDLEGLTSVEIAEMVGDTPGAVKVRLHRARRKLQAVLEANCDLSYDEHGVFGCQPRTRESPRARPEVYPSAGSHRPEGQE